MWTLMPAGSRTGTPSGYDPDTREFELFNPWGLHNVSGVPGIVHLTFDEITANYSDWGYGSII